MHDKLKIAVERQNEQELVECLAFGSINEVDACCYNSIEKALLGTWHSQHEDLLSTIIMKRLADDRFVEPILNIALHRQPFRWYDDELEPTLRKCVHALMTIDSDKSHQALKQLESLGNDNVKLTLELYNQNRT
ncbi:hypothetical protein [Hymenobacter aerophilus]|uniref:hypothetical protein n=1 Tax=Hymenobacter aerophilus TaxID=119644 RepID=UPI0003796E73|nr:hypothetical protein [Hymenobacter aerophilus]